VIDVDKDQLAKAVLIALADACSYSPIARVPEGAILRKFPTHLRGDASKKLQKLSKTPYVIKHPSGRNLTYNISRQGITKAQE